MKELSPCIIEGNAVTRCVSTSYEERPRAEP